MENVWKMMSDHSYSSQHSISVEEFRAKVLEAVDKIKTTKITVM